jgi:hypothetical protein
VQLGEHHLDTTELGLRLDVDRDTACLVAHLDRAVLVQHDVDPVAVAGQSLVDGVVDDLPQAVHQAAAVGGPDVHTGPLAHRLQTLQHEQVPGVVRRVEFGAARGRSGHWTPCRTRVIYAVTPAYAPARTNHVKRAAAVNRVRSP